jgi:hypothetical protein
MDIDMPIKNGYQASLEILENLKNSDLSIIITSNLCEIRIYRLNHNKQI